MSVLTRNVETSPACEDASIALALLLENKLSVARKTELQRHIESCADCRQQFTQVRQVHVLLGNAFEGMELSSNFDENAGRKLASMRSTPGAPGAAPQAATIASSFDEIDPDRPQEPTSDEVPEHADTFLLLAGRTPWWFVSCALHMLVIALAGLVTMAIELPHSDDSVITVTELQPRSEIQSAPEKTQTEVAEILRPETPATDPNSKEASDIVVPPEILAQAELGDHFETINPDRPDTHGAYGNEEARMSNSLNGNADAAGGGGTGGVSLEDVIGAGGAATRGSGGGFGGGDGSGIGVGHGAGKGSFGNRNSGGRKLMVKRNGGSPASESAVDRGLEWLAYHQEPDGHWDCQKYQAQVMPAAGYHGVDCVNTGMTGLALMAFLGAGHTEKVGKYKENVVRAVAWLKSKQDKDGAYCIFNYGHQMAAMAMAEAAGMARIPETMESAQKAVNCTCAVNRNYQTSDRWSWCYSPQQIEAQTLPGHGDMSNSGWAFMFLKSAKVAGLKVPSEAIEGAIRFMNACECDKVAGDSYSGHHYHYAVGPNYTTDHAGYIAILGRIFFGTSANEVEGGVKYMVEKWGLPGAKNGKHGYDMYYYYYMTLNTFQVGGDVWSEWNKELLATLLPGQVKGGDNTGSWDPQGSYADHWGRVGQTALSVLCLEVYYRYQRLSGK